MDEKIVSLSNKDNYLTELDCDYHELTQAYIVMVEYYITTIEQTVRMDDRSYYRYILCKGVENLKNIFRLLLVYTKNKAMSAFQTEKAMLYYVEFMGQISNEHSFIINLNGKDATLFIFKKTLYDLAKQDSSMTDADMQTLSVVDRFIDTHSAILKMMVFSADAEDEVIKSVQAMHKKLCSDVDRFIMHHGIIGELIKRVSADVTSSQLVALIAVVIKSESVELVHNIELDDLKELSLHRLVKRVLTTT